MEQTIDPMRDAAAYSVSIIAKIVPIVDEYILCRMKIDQLRTEGMKRNHLNDSHRQMIDTLFKQADNIKLDLLYALDSPFMDNTNTSLSKA